MSDSDYTAARGAIGQQTVGTAEAVIRGQRGDDPLATLRAEVEQRQDIAATEAERAPDGGVIEHWWIGYQRGMETVLDLIDKHTREGQ